MPYVCRLPIERMEQYRVLGIMSGTSMDGVDLAGVAFEHNHGSWRYTIEVSETIPFPEVWRVRLSKLNRQDALVYARCHVYFGKYLGELVNAFIKKHQWTPELVASHGHTVFHQPELGISMQIGDGATLAAECGLPVVCDFRSGDVALGGQGAPLVPVGDRLLFSEYDFCLNLGGIANISGKRDGKTMAYDICPCNIGFNRIARNLGKLFDEGGEIAASGKVDEALLADLNRISYYNQSGPKSLSREWINTTFWPLTKDRDLSNEDKSRTLVEHAAVQISRTLFDWVDGEEEALKGKRMLVTGGGTLNDFLMSRIKAETSVDIVVPDVQLIDFKEALVFAFLGVLRIRNEENILRSVTGASRNSIGGALYGDFSTLMRS